MLPSIPCAIAALPAGWPHSPCSPRSWPSPAVIGQSLRADERSTAAPPGTRTVSSRDGGAPAGSASPRRRYTVRAGDTLTGIADRTGVPLGRLQQLNPKLDSDSLQTGQRIKLSP